MVAGDNLAQCRILSNWIIKKNCKKEYDDVQQKKYLDTVQ